MNTSNTRIKSDIPEPKALVEKIYKNQNIYFLTLMTDGSLKWIKGVDLGSNSSSLVKDFMANSKKTVMEKFPLGQNTDVNNSFIIKRMPADCDLNSFERLIKINFMGEDRMIYRRKNSNGSYEYCIAEVDWDEYLANYL
ncbi:RNA-binding protein [Sarcoptes scabiei]|nr:RNA-binding protein [Sarcoptes scabiei]UXI16446.1 RNA-binding protein [Sarcoptes scabiei]